MNGTSAVTCVVGCRDTPDRVMIFMDVKERAMRWPVLHSHHSSAHTDLHGARIAALEALAAHRFLKYRPIWQLSRSLCALWGYCIVAMPTVITTVPPVLPKDRRSLLISLITAESPASPDLRPPPGGPAAGTDRLAPLFAAPLLFVSAAPPPADVPQPSAQPVRRPSSRTAR
jgi:hypothetical protein